MNPNIHLATESDADTLLTLMREYYTFDGHSFDPPKAHEALLGLLRDPSFGRAWIVLLDATVIGYIVLCFGYSLEYHGRDSFLDEFYLKEDYRRRGIGQRVLQLVEEEAGSLGIRSIHLEVVRRNEGAVEFYRKAGYRDHQHRLMTKPLFALN